MILHRYIARRFAIVLASVWAVFFALLGLIDLIEQARRYGADTDGIGPLLGLTLLSVPAELYRILPLIVIVAALALFLGLARSSEMVVIRASGRSALRMLTAPVAVALLVGLAGVAVMNPIVAATSSAFEARVDDLRGRDRILALPGSGVWLRQGADGAQTVIHADRTSLDGTDLTGATFHVFAANGTPLRRIEAASATLGPGAWTLRDARTWPLDAPNPEASATTAARLEVPSTLTAERIRDSFGAPSAIPVWELPAFIAQLRAAGFTARRHVVHLQMELAAPLFLAAMVLIAAAFTLRHQRGGNTGLLVLLAVLVSFGAYFIRNFARILAETGQVPPILAAWAPPVAAACLALGLLLHLEDG